MSDFETVPGDLGQPHRRAMEKKLQTFSESVGVRLALFVLQAVIAIALPLVGWGMSTVIDRLNKIDAALTVQSVTSATTDLRVLNLERSRDELALRLSDARDKVLVLEFQVQRLNRKE